MTSKALVLFFPIFLVCNLVSAQDLIVTKSNDSIPCKITKVKKDNIYFVFRNNGEYQSTLIPLKDVESYKYDFYSENRIPKESLPGYDPYTGFRFALSGGYSYDPGRLNSAIDPSLEGFYDNLKSGYHLETSVIYFVDRTFGFGVKYSLFKTSNSLDNVNFIDSIGNVVTGTLASDISVSFIGGVFATRFMGKKAKNAFFINLGLGYLSYKDNQILVDPFEFTGSAFGSVLEIGYDFAVSEDLAIGIQIGATAGRIRKLDVKSESVSETVELSDDERPGGSGRIDFSVGLRYNL